MNDDVKMTKPNEPDELQQVPLNLKYPDQFPSYYANLVRIVRSEHDICLDFGLVATPQRMQPVDNFEIDVRVIAQVLIPKAVASNLIRTIYEQLPDADKAQLAQTLVATLMRLAKEQGVDIDATSEGQI